MNNFLYVVHIDVETSILFFLYIIITIIIIIFLFLFFTWRKFIELPAVPAARLFVFCPV